MDAAEEVVIKFPIKTKLVCSSCGAPGEGSCRCGAPYVTPGERAEAAVKANPGKSDRAIAEELGVGTMTVSRARHKTTVPDGTVEKRTGKDGKKRKQPKPRGAGKTAHKYQQSRPAVRGAIVAGQVLNTKEVAAAQGVSVDTVERAALAEQARFDLLVELDVDPTTLSPSAQAKLEIAKRLVERKLNAEHAARMRGVDEEVRVRVVAEGKDYIERMKVLEDKAWKEEKHWREMNEKLKHPLTKSEWYLLHKCVHNRGNAAHPEDLDAAATLLNVKRDALLGRKK